MKQPLTQTAYQLWASLILLLAFFLRLLDAGSRSLWFDEAVEYLTANAPLSELPAAVVHLNYQPPLFSLLLHGWMQASIQPLWLRYFTISLTLLSLVGIMKLAFMVAGRRASLIAGLVTAVLPTELFHAQDVGEYALLVCCLTWSLFFLYRACEKERWRDWVAWLIFALMAVYSHYGAAIIILPLTGMTLLAHTWQRRWTAVIRQLTVMLAAFFFSLPLLVFFLPAQIRRVTGSAFTRPVTSWWLEVAQFTTGMADNLAFHLIGWPMSNLPKWPVMLVLVLLGIMVILFWRRLPRRPFYWLAAVYIFYYLLVRAGLYVGFGLRYSLIFTPLLVLIIALLLDQLWHHQRAAALGLLGFIVVLELFATPHATLSQIIRNSPRWSPGEQMEPVFQYWQEHRQASQPTFVYYGAVPAFRYYLRLFQLDPPLNTNPLQIKCTAEGMTPTCQKYHLFYSDWTRHLTSDEKLQHLAQTLGGWPPEFWLVFSHIHETEDQELIEQLQSQ